MAEQTTAKSGKRFQDLTNFTIELGTENCGQVQIGSFRTMLRGRWSVATLHAREGGAGYIGPAMSAMPDIPGVHITVDFKTMTCRIWDPLHDDPDLCERIDIAMKRARLSRGTGVKGIDEAVHPLSSDDMKTLLRELRQRVDANEARVTEGRMPSLHDIDACPGRELYDIWSSNAHRPRYRDEAPEWEREIISRASYR